MFHRVLWVGAVCAAAAGLPTWTQLQRDDTLHHGGRWDNGKPSSRSA